MLKTAESLKTQHGNCTAALKGQQLRKQWQVGESPFPARRKSLLYFVKVITMRTARRNIINLWNVVDIGHSTHRDGHGVDIRSDKVGAMEKGGVANKSYDKDKSVSFAKKAIAKGFRYILTLCPHVTKECNTEVTPMIKANNGISIYVNQVSYHHHHLHMDYWPHGSSMLNEHINRAYCEDCEHSDSCNSIHKQK